MQKYPGGHLTIYYGSQTGTAESFAQQIAREGDEHGFKVHVIDLEDVTEGDGGGGSIEGAVKAAVMDPARADPGGRSRAVFLMATYGEGEPTDNAAQFVALIKEKAGIGSNYNFEAVGRPITGKRRRESTGTMLLLVRPTQTPTPPFSMGCPMRCLLWATASTSTFAPWVR